MTLGEITKGAHGGREESLRHSEVLEKGNNQRRRLRKAAVNLATNEENDMSCREKVSELALGYNFGVNSSYNC